MGKWTTESHGQKFWEQLAQEKLSDEKIIKKIWSNNYEAWGFFDSALSGAEEFVLWCGSRVGDRFHLGSIGMEAHSVGVILERCDSQDGSKCVIKILRTDGRIVELAMSRRKLFDAAWNLTK